MTRYASRAAAERRLLELHAATCSIFAHPTRLAMIEALRDGERTGTDLVDAVGTAAGNTSPPPALGVGGGGAGGAAPRAPRGGPAPRAGPQAAGPQARGHADERPHHPQ